MKILFRNIFLAAVERWKTMVLLYRHMVLAVALVYTIMAIFKKGSSIMSIGFAISMLFCYFSLLAVDFIFGSPCFFMKPKGKVLFN